MSVLGGALSYRKKSNDFYVNETGTNDGWVPLPISVGAQNLTEEDLRSWADRLGGRSQTRLYVNESSSLASDSKDNRGYSPLKPFKTLERALLEAARTSIKKGPNNDAFERISICLAPGEYEIFNGSSDSLGEFENYGRFQDAANLIGRNRVWIIENAYQTLAIENRTDVLKQELGYFLNALINDLTIKGNYFTLRAAKTIVSKDRNLVTENPPPTGYFIQTYMDEDVRIDMIEALEEVRLRANLAMRNLGVITDPDIIVDTDNPTCIDVEDTITNLINILKDTLSCSLDPRIEGLVSYGSVSRGDFPSGEPTRTQLQSFNSLINSGVILPRGVSIIGEDLRKVVIRPKYVPDPLNTNVPRGALFRMTGGNFVSNFTIKDARGVEHSHHKLSAFEFCTETDLNVYYDQVRLAFADPEIYNRAQDAAFLLEKNLEWIILKGTPSVVPNGYLNYAKIFEAEITNVVNAFKNDLRGLTNSNSKDLGERFFNAHILPLLTNEDKAEAIAYYEELLNDLMPFIVMSITNEAFVEEGGYQDYRIISDPGGTFDLNGETYSGRCANIQAALFTFKEIIIDRIKSQVGEEVFGENYSDGDAEAIYAETSIVLGLNSSQEDISEVQPELVDTVFGASPYIFSASIRSEYGMCGIDGDGDLVTGLKSYLAAQFTVVSLQKDQNAFTPDPEEVGGFRYKGSKAADTADWRNFGYSVQNGAYAQLVSCFCIGPANHYINYSGGELSITNSTSNFGDISLYSHGFRDDGSGGGAYPQDRGYKLVSIKKPKPIDSVPRRYNLGTISSVNFSTGAITLNGLANTRNFKLIDSENPSNNSKIYVRLAGGLEVSATVVEVENDTSNPLSPFTTITVNTGELSSWGSNVTNLNVFIRRYADFRSLKDKKYYLVVESDPIYGNRAPTVDYIIRKTCAFTAEEQPFTATWDSVAEAGNLYYVDSVSRVLSPTEDDLGYVPLEDKEYYLITVLSAYADEEGGIEHRSNLDRSVELNLDLDPSLVDLNTVPTANLSYKGLDRVLRILGVDYTQLPTSSYELTEDRFVPINSLALRIDLNKPSIIRAAGQTWEFVGYYNYSTGLPQLQKSTVGAGLPPSLSLLKRFLKLQTLRYGGKIYATGMDELGNLFQGYRVIDFKTGESSAVDLSADTIPIEDLENGDILFPTYYPSLTIDNLVVNEQFEYNGEELTLNNDPVINAENGLTLRIGGTDVIVGSSDGEITSIFDNKGSKIIVSETPPEFRIDGSPLEPGDVWFDQITSGTFMRIPDVFGNQVWAQINEYVPPEKVNGWPGFVNPLIPTDMLPLQSPAWDSGDTTLESDGCLQISKTNSNYGNGPLFIANGEQLWVRWNPGSSVACGGRPHGSDLEGTIFDNFYFVAGSLELDRVPGTINLGGSNNYPLSTLYSSNVVTLTNINASTKFWVESTNAVGTISYRLNGGSWTTITPGFENAVDIAYLKWPTLQFRVTSSSSNSTLTTLTARVGDSNSSGDYSEGTLELWTIAAATVDPLISTPSILSPSSLQQFEDSVEDIVITSSSYVANAESGAHLNSDWEVWRGSSTASSFAADTTKVQIVNATNQTGSGLTSYTLTAGLATSGARYYVRVRHRGSTVNALSSWSAYRIFDILNPLTATLSTSSNSVTAGSSITVSYSVSPFPLPPSVATGNFYRLVLYRSSGSLNTVPADKNSYVDIKTLTLSTSSGSSSFSNLQSGNHLVALIIGPSSSNLNLNTVYATRTFTSTDLAASWTVSWSSDLTPIVFVTNKNSVAGTYYWSLSSTSVSTSSSGTFTIPAGTGNFTSGSLGAWTCTGQSPIFIDLTIRSGSSSGPVVLTSTGTRSSPSFLYLFITNRINNVTPGTTGDIEISYSAMIGKTLTLTVRWDDSNEVLSSSSTYVPPTCGGRSTALIGSYTVPTGNDFRKLRFEVTDGSTLLQSRVSTISPF